MRAGIGSPDTRIFAALIACNVILIWALPALVGHDLPQHLAYARILERAHEQAIARTYVVSDADLYSTTHWLLATLARVTTLDIALRLVFSTYAVLVPLGFALLVRSIHGSARGVKYLGVLLIWNPVICMGLLPFALTLPAFMFGAAFVLRFARAGRAGDLVALAITAALLGCLHVVALAMFIGFLSLLLLSMRRARVATAMGVAVAVASLFMIGRSDVRAVHQNHLLAGNAIANLGAFWTSSSERANVALATLFGPFPHAIRAALIVVCAACAVVVAWRALHFRAASGGRQARAFAWAACAFTIGCALAPSSVRTPDDLSLIDFRMWIFAQAVVLAMLSPAWLVDRVAHTTLLVGVVIFNTVWGVQLRGAASEASAAIAAVSPLGADSRLLALSFHDRSAYLDESNAVLHYLPVYHTALTGGVTSTFWAKYSPHLPLGYREGLAPSHPPDWQPWEFTNEDVRSATHVLVTLPDTDDDPRAQQGALRLMSLGLPLLKCVSRYCVYSTNGALDRAAAAN